MIFEDVHWIDPTSRDVLSRMIDRICRLPALLIVTFRPEFEAPWVDQPHATLLSLNRLARRDCRAMLEQIVGNTRLPGDVVEDIIARTDGVPLFVEELTKGDLAKQAKRHSRAKIGIRLSSAKDRFKIV
jgi:predicted ATPase